MVAKQLLGKLVPAILFLQSHVHLVQSRAVQQSPQGILGIAKAPKKSRVIT